MRRARIKYSQDELDWIQSNAHRSRREIAGLFSKKFDRSDVTEDHIKALCSRNGWSAGKEGKRRNAGKSIVFNPEQVQWLKDHAELSRRDTHDQFVKAFPGAGISLDQIIGFKKRHGIKTGRSGRFEKGQQSWNKGQKMPFNPNSAATQFKAGQLPHNHKGVGHEMICPKDGYVYMIVEEKNPHTGADTRRVLKHRWFWEKENGPLADGHCLKCIDSDKTNTNPLNWMSIPRGLLPLLNSRWATLRYDDAEPEIKPYILTAARLKRAAKLAKLKPPT